MLKATYGDFYVAEMIEAQNENNRCVAAEVCYIIKSFFGLKMLKFRLVDLQWALWLLQPMSM